MSGIYMFTCNYIVNNEISSNQIAPITWVGSGFSFVIIYQQTRFNNLHKHTVCHICCSDAAVDCVKQYSFMILCFSLVDSETESKAAGLLLQGKTFPSGRFLIS